MIPILLLLLVSLVAILLVVDTKKGILAALIARPIVDCFWDNPYAVLGLRPTELMGVLVPLLVFLKILISSEQKFFRYPFAIAWAVYTWCQILSTLMMASQEGLLQGLNYFFRAFNGYMGFLAFQEFFYKKDDFKKLLFALIIAGITPLSMSVYQNILGGTIATEDTVGGLLRNIGFYHDAYSMRYYCFQTLTALILYGSYFLRQGRLWLRGLITTLGILCIMTIYRIFSKAGYLILAEWAAIWYLFRKNVVVVLAILILGGVTLSLTGMPTLETLETVYSKEIGALEGKVQLEKSFQGRWLGWEAAFNRWLRSPFYLKLIGTGEPATGMHNDFLRALIGTGIIGLGVYLFVLGWAALKALVNCAREVTPLNIMTLMLIVMWLTDAVGLVPGAYPGYQIYVWGFVGLAFKGVEGLNENLATSKKIT